MNRLGSVPGKLHANEQQVRFDPRAVASQLLASWINSQLFNPTCQTLASLPASPAASFPTDLRTDS